MRPRIDWLTPSRPSAAACSSRPAGMPGPSSRTEISTRSGNPSSSTQARASGPTCWATLSRQAADHGDQLGGDLGRQLDGAGGDDLDAGTALEVDQRGGEVGAAGGAGRDLVLLADQGAQHDLLLAGQPAQRGGVPAELGTPALHEAEHLQHAVVDGAGQPGALGGGGRVALGAVPLVRHPLERLDHEPHDRTSDQQEEGVAVVGLGDVLADRQVRDGDARPRRPGRRASASGSPTPSGRPSPSTPAPWPTGRRP